MSTPLIYLDYAAATPLDTSVLRAMVPYFSEKFYNPSATYLLAKEVKEAIEESRRQIAQWLGAKSSEIIFTAGGSEANNLAIHGVMPAHPEGNIVISAMEHDSVIKPAEQYASKEVSLQPDGRIDLADLSGKIDGQTVLVSIMYANNEIGTIQPIREIAKIIEQARAKRLTSNNPLPLYFHTDAAQAPNYLDLHVSRLGVDLMTINGGKIYGPKQSGALYVKAGLRLKPHLEGGGQERGLRSGTENVPGIMGLGLALDVAQTMRREESERLKKLQTLFITKLGAALPTAQVNGSLKYRLPNNIHLTIPGTDNERMLIQLEQAGVLAAAGSACSASHEESSHVLKAIGLNDNEARASLRLSMGRGTTEAMVSQCLRVLKQLS